MAIAKGSKGQDVLTVQMQLNKVGYRLDTDGIFGPATDAAVKDFQRKSNLRVTGIVDDATEEALAQGILRASQQVQVVRAQSVVPSSGIESYLPTVLIQPGVTGFKLWQELAAVVGVIGLWAMMKD